jgi:hypothetical protein
LAEHHIWLVLAFGIAGAVAFIALRFSSIFLRQLLESNSKRTRQLEDRLDLMSGLLERIARALEQRAESTGLDLHATSGEARRADTLQDRIAELKAAREVNDPARVLELFRTITPALEPEPRGLLQSEVAEWFLALLYRRLRTGKIQVDVVELAGQFAETFAATAQGASVRAALPMLRRSAGLCPRCAQPYTGIGQACPECLRPGSVPAAPDFPPIDPDQTE